MMLDCAALRKRAAEFELKESQKVTYDSGFVSKLEALLLAVYSDLCPKPTEYEQRRRLVQIFNKVTKDAFGCTGGFPVMEPFGSFTMDLFIAESDLDLSLNFSDDDAIGFPRDRKISALRKLSKLLYKFQRKGRVSGVLPIMGARVPVLKVVDRATGIECDISVENKDGMSRSSFFSFITSIDERFRVLSYLMKYWAKAHDINSSKENTMNSLTIISLVAFHLQTRNPPILPPFSLLFKDGSDLNSVRDAVHKFKSFGTRNEETIPELFVSLFIKLLSVESFWQDGLCASTYEGSWVAKTWESGVGDMSVEDFLDQSQNFARCVKKGKMQTIYKCIKDSLGHLACFLKGQRNASKLRKLLFGSIPLNVSANEPTVKKGMDLKRKLPLDDYAEPLHHTVRKKKIRRTKVAGENSQDFHPILQTPSSNIFVPLCPPVPPPYFGNRSANLEYPHPVQPSYGIEYQPQRPRPPQSEYWFHHHFGNRRVDLETLHPVHPSFGLGYHPQPPMPPESGYWLHHHLRPQFIPSFYGPDDRGRLRDLNQLHYGLQSHLNDQDFALLGPWDDGVRNFPSAYHNQDARYPPYPYGPPQQLGYHWRP